MYEPEDMRKLEDILRSSQLVSVGFLGDERRSLEDIIEADTSEIRRLGKTLEQVGERMERITAEAKAGLGTMVKIDGELRAEATDVRGFLPCPWPHPGRYAKTVTMVRRMDSDSFIQWSDLNIHMIKEHGFFEGKGSPFRIEPDILIRVIF